MTRPLLIAQNLNSSDPAIGGAIAAGDARWLRECVRRIEQTGVDFVDLNAGALGDGEAELLRWLVESVEPFTRLPLSVDSADPELLVGLARGRARPGLLNSFQLGGVGWEDLSGLPEGWRLVLQPRRDGVLPGSARERRDWSVEGLDRLAAAGVDPASVLVDAIALPWGENLQAGAAMLDFIEAWAIEFPATPTLVGLGNIGHGHPGAVGIHREWLAQLCERGVGAVLLDAFETGLRAVLPPEPGPAGS